MLGGHDPTRSCHEDAGGFDPRFRYVLDWDFWLRVSRRWKVAWLARPSVKVRWHVASETHRFKAGTADLDESAAMLETLFSVDLKDQPGADRLRRLATRRLARAYLNRAHDALHAGRADLARESLRRGLALAPSQITTLIRDPRLGLRMAWLIAGNALSLGAPEGSPRG